MGEMRMRLLQLILLCLLSLTWTETGATRSPKKGLVIPSWPRHFCYDFEAFTTISWWYNYLPVPEAEYHSKWWCMWHTGSRPTGEDREHCFPSDPAVQFVPMIRDQVGFNNGTVLAVSQQYPTILGFNEPNQPDQANLSPLEAALAWVEVQEKYPDRELVSPATGHVDTEWFDQFMVECELLGCRFDYLATHWYGNAQGVSAEHTIQILRDYSERYGGKKIWFTEFAVAREHEENTIIQYIQELLPLLEHSDFIHKYSWFISRYYEEYDDSGWFWIDPINSLLEQNTSRLSNIGKAYNKPYHLDMYKPQHLP